MILQLLLRQCSVILHISMGPSDSDISRVEGLGRLTLRFGTSQTIRPERVLHSMFCFQR